MYLRNVDYKKFGFPHLRTLDSTPAIKYKDTIDYSPYVSDEEAYKNIIDLIERQKHPQFLQLSTMQNHMQVQILPLAYLRMSIKISKPIPKD